MRKYILILFYLSTLYSCASSIKRANKCHENLKFKSTLFKEIAIVEQYTLEQKTPGKKRIITESEFLNSITFITKYSNIQVVGIYNYQVGYKSIEDFNIDKRKWIDWYQKNKCNNIKL